MKTMLNVAVPAGASDAVLSLESRKKKRTVVTKPAQPGTLYRFGRVRGVGGQEADDRRAAKKEVEALRESCEQMDAIEHALVALDACPAEAFREPGLFSADRTEEDEIVLDWDADDGGPSITLFVAPSGNTVYVCQWDDDRRVTGNDGHDSEYLRETLGGAFRRLSKERRHAEDRSRLVG